MSMSGDRLDVNKLISGSSDAKHYSYVDRSARVGDRTLIYPGVFIGPYVEIGEDCVIGPGACIGQPGFKYEEQNCPTCLGDGLWSSGSVLVEHGHCSRCLGAGRELVYREHSAGVIIGDDVHIGANACIDQGRHRATEIRRGAKIDNLVHIAHNVIVGEYAMVIALSEISGSCEIGDWAHVAPGVSTKDHVNVGAGALVGVGAAVVTDVPAGETWAGVPARKLR